VHRNFPRRPKCVRTVLGLLPYVSLGHPESQVVYLSLYFQWHQFYPNPIFDQKVMIEILEGVWMAWPSVRTINCNRLSKIALKYSISRPRPDCVALASRRLHFWFTTCLTKNSIRTVCRCLPIFVSETETQFLLEHWMASGRYCHVVRTDALEHWILLELLIASGWFAITSGRMQSWTVRSF